jgi:LmbE family N-acetylglucosaminyl deacetylase
VDLGTLLAVFAHPDDEAYLAGALMAVAADAGRRVVCVTATSGELGFPDDDPRPLDARAELRRAELAACLAVLGVEEHHWLDYPDGGCAAVPDAEPARRLGALIEDVRPDTVLTFGPDGQTHHPDHIAVSRWTTLACRRAPVPPRLLYAAMTREWIRAFEELVPIEQVMMVPGAEPATVEESDLALWFAPEGALLDRKVEALRRQESQIDGMVARMGLDRFRAMVRDEMFRLPTAGDWPASREDPRAATRDV